MQRRTMQTQTNWLAIGQVGAVELKIPIYTLGSGKPSLGITCSVHGDEHAGLYVAARLVELLQSTEEVRGSVHIVLAANPAAQFQNSRVSTLDQKDLNRVGRGRQEGSITERAGAQLFDFLSKCNFVVNIHEFEMHTPTTAVFMNAGTSEIKSKILAAIKVFDPEIIWAINPSQNVDMQYLATLDTALAEAGVGNFPVETTN